MTESCEIYLFPDTQCNQCNLFTHIYLHLVKLCGKGSWIVHAFSVFKRVPLLQGFWQLDPAAMQPWRPRRTKTPKGWFIWNPQGSSRKVSEHLGETVMYSMIQPPEECSNSKMFGSKSNETCPKQTTIAFWAFWLNVIQKNKHNKRVSVYLCVFPQRGLACWTRLWVNFPRVSPRRSGLDRRVLRPKAIGSLCRCRPRRTSFPKILKSTLTWVKYRQFYGKPRRENLK